jgi:hypothetical protein
MAARKKKFDPLRHAQDYFSKVELELLETELLLLKKREAESKYGKELSDLNRLIGELDQSILELPDGGLKTASIERRKELEFRKQNLAIRYPKGTEQSEELLLKRIEIKRTQLLGAKELLDKVLEREAKKVADTANNANVSTNEN